jgi:hypothetical protein
MIERYIQIRCDNCQVYSDTEDAACVTETQFRRDLKECGWKFEKNTRLHDKQDLCPACAKGGA